MDVLQTYLEDCRKQGISDDTIRETLLNQGWSSEQVNSCLATEAVKIISPVSMKGGLIRADPGEMVVDPGYLASFSWGYFGTSLVYAFTMRLSLWYYIAPVAYILFWALVRIPLAVILGLIPFIGPIVFLILNVCIPIVLMYYLSHTVRQPAYYGKTRGSDYEFMQSQDVWDKSGKIVFTLIVFCGLIFGGVTYSAARKLALENEALDRCGKQAFSAVYGSASSTGGDFLVKNQKMKESTATCMKAAGYPSYSTQQPTPYTNTK